MKKESIDIGILVDAVNEVIDIPSQSIEPTPVLALRSGQSLFKGLEN